MIAVRRLRTGAAAVRAAKVARMRTEDTMVEEGLEMNVLRQYQPLKKPAYPG